MCDLYSYVDIGTAHYVFLEILQLIEPNTIYNKRTFITEEGYEGFLSSDDCINLCDNFIEI